MLFQNPYLFATWPSPVEPETKFVGPLTSKLQPDVLHPRLLEGQDQLGHQLDQQWRFLPERRQLQAMHVQPHVKPMNTNHHSMYHANQKKHPIAHASCSCMHVVPS